MISEMIDLMAASRLFAGFSREECVELQNALRPVLRTYHRHEMVLNTGEYVNRIGLVRSGRLTCEKFYYAGNSHLISVLEPMDLVGIESVATPTRISPVTVTSQAYTSILFFDYDLLTAETVLHRTQKMRIMENMIHILGNEGIRQMYKIEVLSKRSLRGRVMTYLWLMAQKLRADSFSIRMTQEQLAQYLCVNRSALSSELNAMEREGLIQFTRDQFTICRSHPLWNEWER